MFIERKSPDTNRALSNPGNYNCMLMNPAGNKANLDPGYLGELNELPERLRKRFRDGQFGEAGEGALWTEELLEQQRVENEIDLPDFQRIVIGIDPSGSRDVDDMHRDEVGIVVVAIGSDGAGYVLEDLTRRGSPAEWGQTAVLAYQRWGADRFVVETNYGGAMATAVLKSAAAEVGRQQNVPLNVSITEVTASRGKVVRAEPISALYEQQKVWHVEGLNMLEAEMVNMTVAGYLGDRSPNRVDALVWALTALFHAVVKSSRDSASGRGPTAPKVNLGHSALKQRMQNIRG
jgi:phage terminase large subunit-like protein